MVKNVHHRILNASQSDVGKLLDTFSSKEDKLWPIRKWPKMKFDGELEIGAKGGHGPIRYYVEKYEVGRSITFRFTGPRGFDGTHGFYIDEIGQDLVKFEHRVEMELKGSSRISWPMIYGPLHDALMEDALDIAEIHIGKKTEIDRSYSLWVRFLRWSLSRGRKRKK